MNIQLLRTAPAYVLGHVVPAGAAYTQYTVYELWHYSNNSLSHNKRNVIPIKHDFEEATVEVGNDINI